jgi:hypothetical protein
MRDGAYLYSSRLSDDGCVLAFYEAASRDEAIISIQDFCDDRRIRIDLREIQFGLTAVQAAWSFSDE